MQVKKKPEQLQTIKPFENKEIFQYYTQTIALIRLGVIINYFNLIQLTHIYV